MEVVATLAASIQLVVAAVSRLGAALSSLGVLRGGVSEIPSAPPMKRRPPFLS